MKKNITNEYFQTRPLPGSADTTFLLTELSNLENFLQDLLFPIKVISTKWHPSTEIPPFTRKGDIGK